jgi:polysaccharide export outer membrane protein
VLINAVTVLFISAAASAVIGQTNDRSKNNPYSPSPSSSVRDDKRDVKPPTQIAFVVNQSTQVQQERPVVAQPALKIPAKTDRLIIKPSELYKVGIGDVLFIDLKNAPRSSGYYTVRPDGTIDFPLAGDRVVAADQTCDDLQESLTSRIRLFSAPKVEVKVRQYASHKVTIKGMVENAGDMSLQREAMPLFIIRAQAGVRPTATKVSITRSPGQKPEIYELGDTATDNVLIYPGNKIEFTGQPAGERHSTGTYFIAGDVNSAGQKELLSGMTLYQAILASGGEKGSPKKATIRRKGAGGTLNTVEHNLRSIKSGRSTDPVLASGDMIEIGN